MAPSSTICLTRRQFGSNRMVWSIANFVPDRLHASITRSASLMFNAIGFSQRIALAPAWAAAIVGSTCSRLCVVTPTISSPSLLNICCMFVYAAGISNLLNERVHLLFEDVAGGNNLHAVMQLLKCGRITRPNAATTDNSDAVLRFRHAHPPTCG